MHGDSSVWEKFLSHEFWFNFTTCFAFVLFAFFLLAISKVVIDWLTPGKLDEQLLGHWTTDPQGQRYAKPPNMAVALVTAGYIVGICIIIAVTLK